MFYKKIQPFIWHDESNKYTTLRDKYRLMNPAVSTYCSSQQQVSFFSVSVWHSGGGSGATIGLMPTTDKSG